MWKEKIYGPGVARAEQNTGDIGLFLLFPFFSIILRDDIQLYM